MRPAVLNNLLTGAELTTVVFDDENKLGTSGYFFNVANSVEKFASCW